MSKKKVVIFGASQMGFEAFGKLKDEYDIVAFSDNNSEKWDTEFCGVKVIRPDDIKKLDRSAIIVASMYWQEIGSQLYEMGLYEMGLNKILFFFTNDANKRLDKYTLLPMCDLSLIKKLHVNEGEGGLFASDFERIFTQCRIIETKPEIIYREKNVLFFAYYFPPIGGSGVQRSLKFVKYLKELGWNPIVISCGIHYKNFATDDSLFSEIPDDITVIRIDDTTNYVDSLTREEMQQAVNLLYGAVNDYGAMSSFLDKIKKNNGVERNYLLHPQKIIMWVLNVLAAVPQIIDFSKIDAVYVTSGPYLSSLIGYYLKNKYKKPWVMDFRDKWTQGIKTVEVPGWVSDFEFALEKNMLENLDALLTVNPGNIAIYNEVFGVPAEKMHLICNGYDEEDFETVDVSKGEPRDKLKIIYNGVLTEKRSNPIFFINAVIDAINDGLIKRKDIEIEFVGERKPISLEDKIKSADIHGVVSLKPYAEHLKSLKNMACSNILLLIILDVENAKNTYTGKIFEYLRMNRRILALVPDGSTIKGLLDETGAGVCISPDDKEGIKNYLRDALNEIRAGDSLCLNKIEIEKHERKNGAKRLAEILDGFVK